MKRPDELRHNELKFCVPTIILCFVLLLFTSRARGQAMEIDKSAGTGLHISESGGDGIHITGSGSDGLTVVNSADYGIRIIGDKAASTLAGHVALIQNSSIDNNADILALRIGKAASPAESNNYITFYNGLVTNNIEGEIDGTGTGGVRYMSAGSDYAEYLPVIDISEQFSPGDLVGVFAGKISHTTEGADKVMVISSQAAVVGNLPKGKSRDAPALGFEIVSFIGQVVAKVRGPVNKGDWIVASGRNDGTGTAVDPFQIRLDHQIIGRAWETQEGEGTNLVNVAVGLDHNEAFKDLLRRHQEQLSQQQTKIDKLTDIINLLISKANYSNFQSSELKP